MRIPQKRNTHEADMQIRIVKTLEVLFKPPCYFWFCPNGGNLSKAQRGKFKAMGLRAGVSDLHFIWPNGGYGVIELKYGKNKEKEEQTEFMQMVELCGHKKAVCYSLDEVYDVLKKWGVPMRGKLF